MGLTGIFLDDVWVVTRVKEVRGSNVITATLHMRAVNKRISAKLRNVEIVQIFPKWFSIIKKPREVSFEGAGHKLLVWKVGDLKPLHSKEITLVIKVNKEKGKEETVHLHSMHASYEKFMGKRWKKVWDGNAGGKATIKM